MSEKEYNAIFEKDIEEVVEDICECYDSEGRIVPLEVAKTIKNYKAQILQENNKLSLCHYCNCMTKKVCGKCKR